MPPPPVWRSVTKQGIPDFSDIQRSAAEIQRLLIKGILYRVRIRYTLPVPGSETLVNFVPLMRQSPSPYHRLPITVSLCLDAEWTIVVCLQDSLTISDRELPPASNVQCLLPAVSKEEGGLLTVDKEARDKLTTRKNRSSTAGGFLLYLVIQTKVSLVCPLAIPNYFL